MQHVTTERIELQLSRQPGREVTIALRRIPAGKFWMGSRGYSGWEEPIHRVVIEQDFWMGETPVTQEQFAVWTESRRAQKSRTLATPR